MMTGTNDKDFSSFFLAFAGQIVTITTNMTTSLNYDSEEGSTVGSVPIYYEGILLDYDDEYFYLGKTPTEITQAVKKSSAVHIMISDEKDVFTELLKEMGSPRNSEDVN